MSPSWKTALENQILGSYKELGNDVLLLASVWSVDEEEKLKPATEIPNGKLNVLRAMQLQDLKNPKVRWGGGSLSRVVEIC
jgi:hypothetical protein